MIDFHKWDVVCHLGCPTNDPVTEYGCGAEEHVDLNGHGHGAGDGNGRGEGGGIGFKGLGDGAGARAGRGHGLGKGQGQGACAGRSVSFGSWEISGYGSTYDPDWYELKGVQGA